MQVALGMGLIVMSQAVQAAQVTFEDYFMSEMSIPAMKIVGYEGVVGTFLMLFVMAPIVRLLPGTFLQTGFTLAALYDLVARSESSRFVLLTLASNDFQQGMHHFSIKP